MHAKYGLFILKTEKVVRQHTDRKYPIYSAYKYRCNNNNDNNSNDNDNNNACNDNNSNDNNNLK